MQNKGCLKWGLIGVAGLAVLLCVCSLAATVLLPATSTPGSPAASSSSSPPAADEATPAKATPAKAPTRTRAASSAGLETATPDSPANDNSSGLETATPETLGKISDSGSGLETATPGASSSSTSSSSSESWPILDSATKVEGAYLKRIRNSASPLPAAIKEIKALTLDITKDQSLLTDKSFVSKYKDQLQIIEDGADELALLDSPSPRFDDTHMQFMQAAGHLKAAATSLRKGIDETDLQPMIDGIKELIKADASFGDADAAGKAIK